MGNIVTCTCEPDGLNPENTLSKLEIKLETYAKDNNLMQYDRNTREILQRLVVLNQSHVSDKLIQLMKEKKSAQKKAIYADLSRVNLEQFDEILYATRSYALLKNSQIKAKVQLKELVRIDQQYIQQGERCLRKMRFLLVVTAMSFGCKQDLNPVSPSDLLSRKSMLQIFLQKAQAFELKYGCQYKICLIWPKNCQFERQFLKNKDLELLIYEPTQPCFTQDNKIKIYGNQIQFNQEEGDLLHYLFNSSIKDSLMNYDYINFCDIKNLASPLINPAHLGYLSTQTRLNILAAIKQSTAGKPTVRNQFIEIENFQLGDVLLKTSVLKQLKKTSNSYQILNTRIERKLMQGSKDCYYFSRLPKDILYIEWADVTKIPYYATDKYEFSNFCKSMLGIENDNQKDLIEVSHCILYGKPSELEKIRNALKNRVQEISFPIMIMRPHSNHGS